MRQSYIYNTHTEHKYCSGFPLMWVVVMHNNINNYTILRISRG